jgi:hypothetical protein
MEELGRAKREVLFTAAVAGRRVKPHILSIITSMDPEEVSRRVKGLFALGLVRQTDSGTPAFDHELIQRAVVDALDTEARESLYQTTANAPIAARQSGAEVDPEEIVHHSVEAGAPRDATFKTLALEAARTARAAGACESVVRYCGLAIEPGPVRDHDTACLLQEKARFLIYLDRNDEAAECLRRALDHYMESGDTSSAAQTFEFGYPRYAPSPFIDARRRALARMPSGPIEWARISCRLLIPTRDSNYEHLREGLNEVNRIAGDSGEPLVQARALLRCGWVAGDFQKHAEAVASCEGATTLAQKVGSLNALKVGVVKALCSLSAGYSILCIPRAGAGKVTMNQVEQYKRRYPYSPTVFFLPPWADIYVTDSERDHPCSHAVAVWAA